MPGSLDGALDFTPELFRITHDPGNVLSTDPSAMLGEPLDIFTQMILQLPQIAIKAIADLLSDPAALADLVLRFPNAGLEAIGSWADSIPLIGPLVHAITGLTGGLLDLEGYFGNFEAFLGLVDFTDPSFNPITAVGQFITTMLVPSGLLAHLVGGFIPGGLIPGLDATQIVSGSFPITMILGLPALLAGFLPGTSILTQLIGTIPGIGSGLTGLSGLGAVFGDLTAILGNPTGLGTGTPSLAALTSIPLLGQFFTGGLLKGSLLPGLDATQIVSGQFPQSMVLGLVDDLAGFLGMGDLAELLTGGPGGETDVINWAANLLDTNSPLDAFNLFGLLPGSLFGVVPVSSIGNTSPELLANATFADASALAGETAWTWDGVNKHSATGGSASTTAAGVNRDLLSNAIPVAEGHTLALSMWVMWTSLTATGNPISLGITAYQNGAVVATPTIAAPTAPTGTQGWTQLQGTYTVPAGVDTVRLRLRVGSTATAGTVKFSDGSVKRTQLLQQGMVNGLLGDLANRVLTGDYANLLSALGGGVGTLPAIISRLGGLLPGGFLNSNMLSGLVPTTVVPELPDTKLPGLGTWVDQIFNSVTGLGFLGVPQADAGGVIQDLVGTVAALGASVAQLVNAQDGTQFFGLASLDALERVSPSNLGTSFWSQQYFGGTSGAWAIADGHNAAWIPGSGVRRMRARRVLADDAKTQTDYQKVSMTIGQQTIYPYSSSAENSMLLRMSDDETVYVRAEVKAGQAQFFYANGGAEQPLGGAVGTSHSPGTNFHALAGTAGNARTFQLIRNSSPILTVTDNAAVTAMGENFRGWGHGATGDSSRKPSSVTQIAIADNTPAPIVGTTMRVYRAATSSVSKGAGDAVLPGGTFDTVDYASPDMQWNGATSTLTILKPGPYLFSSRIEVADNIGLSEDWWPLLYINGTIKSRGGARSGITLAAFGAPAFSRDRAVGGDAMQYYCPAGTQVKVGMGSNSGGEAVVGDAGGTRTWFAATKVG